MQKHLKPGGVVYYNTTGSEDAIFTAAHVFAHVARYQNFVAASDEPFAGSPAERRQRLLQFRRDRCPILDPSGKGTSRVLEELATADLSDKAPEYRRRTDLWLITDDNMATEYKTRSRLLFSPYRWGNKVSRDAERSARALRSASRLTEMRRGGESTPMHPLFRLLVRKAVPLARWALVWWPALCIALFVKKEMVGGDSLAITARTFGKNEVLKNGTVDWLASFSLLEQLSFFRGELLWGLLALPAFSLLLTSGRRVSRWRGPILAVASILLSCLLYAEYGSLRVVGRMLSMSLASDALTFANCCTPMARQYFGMKGAVQLAAVAVLTVGISWWAGRQNRKDDSNTPRLSANAAGTLGLWGIAYVLTFAAWLPWLPTVRYHTSVFATAVTTLVVDEKLDTSAYVGLPLDELARRYRELTHSPEPRPSSYWGTAKDCDVLVFVLETSPARCLPIEGDLSDCPNLARLRERAFVAVGHHTTYPLSNRVCSRSSVPGIPRP